jgi:L-asparaginase
MNKLLIISTGGTFNKIYNPKNGMLEIDKNAKSLKELASKWLCKFEIVTIIGKDSLEITNQDRLELLGTISQADCKHIIVVHGTDTMDITAEYLAEGELDKCIVLTGAMVPYSIAAVESTDNLASAYGYLQAVEEDGVYISMNGALDTYTKVKKDRKKGRFML